MTRLMIMACGSLLVAGTLAAGTALKAQPFAAEAALAEAELARTTGREDVTQLNSADQANQVSNNSINGPSVTGTIRIDDNAFQNMSGLSVLNANTGNNVAINASMQVNVAINPGM